MVIQIIKMYFHYIVNSIDERSQANKEGAEANILKHSTIDCFPIIPCVWFFFCSLFIKVPIVWDSYIICKGHCILFCTVMAHVL